MLSSPKVGLCGWSGILWFHISYSNPLVFPMSELKLWHARIRNCRHGNPKHIFHPENFSSNFQSRLSPLLIWFWVCDWMWNNEGTSLLSTGRRHCVPSNQSPIAPTIVSWVHSTVPKPWVWGFKIRFQLWSRMTDEYFKQISTKMEQRRAWTQNASHFRETRNLGKRKRGRVIAQTLFSCRCVSYGWRN